MRQRRANRCSTTSRGQIQDELITLAPEPREQVYLLKFYEKQKPVPEHINPGNGGVSLSTP
jgi:hypothetical protein